MVFAFQQKHGPVSNNFSIAEYRDLRAQTTEVLANVISYQFGLDGLAVNGNSGRICQQLRYGQLFFRTGDHTGARTLHSAVAGKFRLMAISCPSSA